MPYTQVPKSGQTLGQTRDQIRNNIQALNASLENNHIALDNGADTGKHKYVQMPIRSPQNNAGEGTLYTSTVGGETQLNYITDGQGLNYQLTRTINGSYTRFSTNTAYVSIPPNPNTVSGGWTFLPGGMLLQYGLVNIENSPGTTKVTYPVAFPSGTDPYTIQVTAVVTSSTSGDQTASVRSTSGNGVSFQIGSTSSGNVTQFYWMAIGK